MTPLWLHTYGRICLDYPLLLSYALYAIIWEHGL